MKCILVLLILEIVTSPVLSLPLNGTIKAIEGTCDPALPFFTPGGVKVCLFGKTDNLITDAIGVFGNSFAFIQNILGLGKCYCNQKCFPSQVVCEDGALLKGALQLLNLAQPANPYLNEFVQFVYAIEKYQAYCYCPELISAEEACKPVENPEKCPIPEATTAAKCFSE